MTAPGRRRRGLRALAWASVALAGLGAIALLATWFALRASLPLLDGRRLAAGVPGEVTVERDALGVATVRAPSTEAAAFGLGFVHAQDRFFQMDLSRRLAAGEVADLFGGVAAAQDRRARPFRLRAVARRVLAEASGAERAWLEAYASGVNAGLGALGARPWEYLLLRAQPRRWLAEDSVLAVHAMWWQLQYADIARERFQRGLERRLDAVLPFATSAAGPLRPAQVVLRALYPRGTEWDAPLQPVAAAAAVEVPGPAVIDLRRLSRGGGTAGPGTAGPPPAAATGRGLAPPEPGVDQRTRAGSNNWAIAGEHTASGRALVANDMHLGLGVPPVWYRARIIVPAAGLDLAGVTLPGLPGLVAGSNGRIAWGFTNAYGDWSDVVEVSCDPATNRYETLAGTRGFTVVEETIEVRGEAAQSLQIRESPLGVLIDHDPASGTCALARWFAVEPGATNLRFGAFQQARDVPEAVALAAEVGMPQQNLVVGDREGRIAWTIIGRLAAGDRGPASVPPVSWRSAAERPAVVSPPGGRIWTANARVADGEDERTIGSDEADGGLGYDLGARAGQIRDGLRALRRLATPADMLAIQLDDRALFLARWRTLLLGTLDEDSLKDRPRRAELRRLAERWDARAGVDSVGYRIVREFRDATELTVWSAVLGVAGLEAAGSPPPSRQLEGLLWALVTEQPPHMLPARYADWRGLLLEQVDAVGESMRAACPSLERCGWGARNPVQVRHPLSRGLPWLSRWLDMPTVALPGDHDMPRVQAGAFGASQRFAVSPGRESEGYMQLPGGQSGHPLSAFYRAGFEDWTAGRPAPFLPGPAAHKLTLVPR